MKGNVVEIHKVYDGTDKELVIPVYQRNYDWTPKQCSRLFDDIENMIATGQPRHFFGAVVGRAEDSFTWIVIDGQQRLTTVSLLTLAIVHAIQANEIECDDPALARKLLNNYLYVGDQEDIKCKLKPVKDDARAYELLFEDDAHFVESSNVTVNYRYFRERIAESNLTAEQLWNKGVCALEVMLLDLEGHDNPQRIFESINSTGLALKESDKIRNFILMDLPNKQQAKLYEQFWNPTEKNVDFKTDWFIRWYLTAKTSKTPKEDDVFYAFKDYASKAEKPMPELVKDVFEFSRYANMFTRSRTGFESVDKRLRRANQILGDVTLPFFMPVLRDALSGVITEEDFCDIIKIVETMQFRRAISFVQANALNKIFATAYSEIRKLRRNDESYAEILVYLLRRRDATSGRIPLDDEFLENFETRNSYNLRKSTRRYLFDCLENQDSNDTRDISTGVEDGSLSIEHVMPQTLSPAWRTALGPDAEEIHKTWVNRIANLTVTGYNSVYSNSPFAKKKTMDNGFNSSPYKLNSYIKTQDEWGIEQLKERSRQLTDFAREFWPLPESTFQPPKKVLPTEPMGWETEFTGYQVAAFQYQDASQTVSSWAEALVAILRILVEHYRQELLEYALEEGLLYTYEEGGTDSNPDLRRIDHSLWVFKSTPTQTKIKLLRRVFELLDLDPEELIFTLRSKAEKEEDQVAEQEDSKYSAITKYIPQIEEFAGSEAPLEESRELRQEFLSSFAEFRDNDPMATLGNQPREQFLANTSLGSATAEQVLALISMTVQFSEMMGASVLHQAIIFGDLGAELKALEK